MDEDMNRYEQQFAEPPQSEFEANFRNTQFEQVNPDTAKGTVKALYKRLVAEGRVYSLNPNNLDYNNTVTVDTGHNKIVAIPGVTDNGDNTQFSIFTDKDNNIVGYGGFTDVGENTTQASFKMFPESRGSLKTAQNLFEQNLFTYLSTTSGEIPDRVIVPTNQQYNPGIEKPTNAPLFYRSLGFETPHDASLPADIRARVDVIKSGGIKSFNDDEKVLLSRNELTREIYDADEIRSVRQKQFANIAMPSEETDHALRESIDKTRQLASTLVPTNEATMRADMQRKQEQQQTNPTTDNNAQLRERLAERFKKI